MPLPRETPFPEAAAWRLSPPPAPCFPQTPRRCKLCRNRRADPPPFLHLLPWAPFSPCHQPSPGHPGLTAAPRLWGDRTCGGGRWADSCCGPALSQGHPPPALSQKAPPLRPSQVSAWPWAARLTQFLLILNMAPAFPVTPPPVLLPLRPLN